MCACTISVECAVRRGNFEIAKEPELISQQRKVIFKKQVYHSDQYKNWTSMICFVAYKKNCVVLPTGTHFVSVLYIYYGLYSTRTLGNSILCWRRRRNKI